MITRQDALDLIASHNPEPHMVQHALQSEAVMRALARRLGQDQEVWAGAGLLHDLDYPLTKDTPERHGQASAELLAGRLPAEAVTAIIAHNGEMTGLAPSTPLDFALRAAETVTGLIHAAALMRPTRYEGLEIKSIKKKMKDKAFARAVRRENILECDKLGLPLDEFLGLAIEAMREI